MEKFPEVVELNVGGTNMTTLLTTLKREPDSMLAAMFSGRHMIIKDKEGRYFIDCDGDKFKVILDYLRFGSLPSKENAVGALEMAEYFGIQSMVKALASFQAVRKRVDVKYGEEAEKYFKVKEKVIETLAEQCAYQDVIVGLGISERRYNSTTLLECDAFTCKAICLAEVLLSEKFVWCLAEELHALGYGRFVKVFTHPPDNCEKCKEAHSYTIVLSNREVVRERKDDWDIYTVS